MLRIMLQPVRSAALHICQGHFQRPLLALPPQLGGQFARLFGLNSLQQGRSCCKLSSPIESTRIWAQGTSPARALSCLVEQSLHSRHVRDCLRDLLLNLWQPPAFGRGSIHVKFNAPLKEAQLQPHTANFSFNKSQLQLQRSSTATETTSDGSQKRQHSMPHQRSVPWAARVEKNSTLRSRMDQAATEN